MATSTPSAVLSEASRRPIQPKADAKQASSGNLPTSAINPKRTVCGLVFKSRTVSPEGNVITYKEYLCNFCQFKSDTNRGFQTHLGLHVFTCNHCKYRSFTRYDVIAHKKDKHPKESQEELQGYEGFGTNNASIMYSYSTSDEEAKTPPRTTSTASVTKSGKSLLSENSKASRDSRTEPSVLLQAIRNAPSMSPVSGSVTRSSGTSLAKSSQSVSSLSGVTILGAMSANATSKSAVSTLTSTVSSSVSTNSNAPLLNPSSVSSYFTYKIVNDARGKPQWYECDICGYKSDSLNPMYRHAATHTMSDLAKPGASATVWECYYCSFRARIQAIVVKHVTLKHPGKHIQLKRYSTPLTKSASDGIISHDLPDSTTDGPPVNTTITEGPPGVDSAPDDESAAERNDDDLSSPTTENQTKQKEEEDEDDGSCLWGCYYCDYEKPSRHDVVKHVKEDHSGRKIMITRRRVTITSCSSDKNLPDDAEEENHQDKADSDEENTSREEESALQQKLQSAKKYDKLISEIEESNKKAHRELASLCPMTYALKTTEGAKKWSPVLNIEGGDMPDIEGQTMSEPRESDNDGDHDDEMPVLERMTDDDNQSTSTTDGIIDMIKRNTAKSAKESRRNQGKAAKTWEFESSDGVGEGNEGPGRLYDIKFSTTGVKEACCNSCSHVTSGNLCITRMQEHVKTHVSGETVWVCSYCHFKSHSRHATFLHSRNAHPGKHVNLLGLKAAKSSKRLPEVKTLPKWEKKTAKSLFTKVKRLRGPRSVRERRYLKVATKMWECRYCSRVSVLKGAIRCHMQVVHPDQDCDIDPICLPRLAESAMVFGRDMDLKAAQVKLFHVEHMNRYKVLKQILESNGATLNRELDVDEDDLPYVYQCKLSTRESKGKFKSAKSKEKPERLNVSLLDPSALSAPNAKYQCPYCHVRTMRPGTVKMHIISCHPDAELYIKDLRKKCTTGRLYMCRHGECEFLTPMEKALYAHLGKNPSHVAPGATDSSMDADKLEDTLSSITTRCASLRKRRDSHTQHDEHLQDHIEDDTNKMEEKEDIKLQPPTLVKEKVTSPTRSSCQSPPVEPKKRASKEKSKKVTAVWPKPSKSKGRIEAYRRRPQNILPDDWMDTADVGDDVLLNCQFCSLAVNCEPYLMKEHLSSEHPNTLPWAYDPHRHQLKKAARLHMCVLPTCGYMSYHRGAFNMHLAQAHPNINFPYISGKLLEKLQFQNGESAMPQVSTMHKQALKESKSVQSSERKPSLSVDEQEWEEPPSDIEEKVQKVKKRVSHGRGHHEDSEEEEWKPKKRKKASKRSKESKQSLTVVKSNTNMGGISLRLVKTKDSTKTDDENHKADEPASENVGFGFGSKSDLLVSPDMKYNMDGTLVQLGSKKQTVHFPDRFQCSVCTHKKCFNTMLECKTHLQIFHNASSNSCIDVRARNLRKRQAIYFCFEPECNFFCKLEQDMSRHKLLDHGIPQPAETCEKQPPKARPSRVSKGKVEHPEPVEEKEEKIKVPEEEATRQSNENSEKEWVHWEDCILGTSPPKEKPEESSTERNRKKRSASMSSSEENSRTVKIKLTTDDYPEDDKDDQSHPDDAADTVVEAVSGNDDSQLSRSLEHDTSNQLILPISEDEGQPMMSILENSSDSDDNDDAIAVSDDENSDEEVDAGQGNNRPSAGKTPPDEESDVEMPCLRASTPKPDGDDVAGKASTEPEGTEVGYVNSLGGDTVEEDAEMEEDTSRDKLDSTFGENDAAKEADQDKMHQCSHCTYITTGRANIKSHLRQEHDISSGGYTEINAAFSNDGRVVMNVSGRDHRGGGGAAMTDVEDSSSFCQDSPVKLPEPLSDAKNFDNSDNETCQSQPVQDHSSSSSEEEEEEDRSNCSANGSSDAEQTKDKNDKSEERNSGKADKETADPEEQKDDTLTENTAVKNQKDNKESASAKSDSKSKSEDEDDDEEEEEEDDSSSSSSSSSSESSDEEGSEDEDTSSGTSESSEEEEEESSESGTDDDEEEEEAEKTADSDNK